MPTFKFEAMDTTGGEVKDSDRGRQRGRGPAEDPPDGLLRDQDHGGRPAKKGGKKGKKGRQDARRARSSPSAASPARSSCTFTRQFSTLQDAGLPVLRSLQDPRRPDEARRAQERPHRRGRRRRVGQHAVARRSASTPSASTGSTSTWSRPARPAAPSKSSSSAWPSSRKRPRASSAGSPAPWSIPSWSSRVAVGILTFIMIFIIPKFEKIFDDFKHEAARAHRDADRHVALVRRTTGTCCRCSRSASGCCIKLIRLNKTGAYALDRI